MGKKKIHSENKQARIGERFNREIDQIKEKRIELGIDRKRKSTRLLTELIIRHDSWPEMKRDMANLNLERIKNE